MTQDHSPDPDLARLLEAARADRPPPGTVDASWAALQARIAPPPPGSEAAEPQSPSADASPPRPLEASHPSGRGAAASAPTKGVALGGLTLLAGGALAVAIFFPRPATPPEPEARPEPATASRTHEQPEPEALPATPVETPSAELPSDEPEPEPEPQPQPEPEPQLAPPPAEASSPAPTPKDAPAKPSPPAPSRCPDLAAEAQLLATIHTQLRDDDARAALDTIQTWRRDCDQPALSQEVLGAELLALCALGRESKATQRARSFHRRWPSSTLEARLANTCVGSVFTSDVDAAP